MRVKANAAQAKANKLARAGAIGALDEEAIRHPVEVEPAYIYTAACPDLGKREPPGAVVEARRRYLYGG